MTDFAIQYSEGQKYPASLWNPRYVKTFRTSAEAIDYFLENYQEKKISKQKAQERFLENFPSERVNLEKFLAQSKPKCTRGDDRMLGDHNGKGFSSIALR